MYIKKGRDPLKIFKGLPLLVFYSFRNLPWHKAAQTEHNSFFFFFLLFIFPFWNRFSQFCFSFLKPLVVMLLFETIKAVRSFKSRPIRKFKIWFWIWLDQNCFNFIFLFTEKFYKCGIKTPCAVALIVTSSGKYARAISSSVSGSRKTRKGLKLTFFNK